MKLLVVFLALSALCYADDDDSVEVYSFDDDDYYMPAIPQVKTVYSHAVKAPAPVTFAEFRTVPSPTIEVQASAIPAVMKIPKPNIKFNIPATQTMFKTAEVVPAVATASAPVSPVEIDFDNDYVIPATTFQSGINALPIPYYASANNFKATVPRVYTVPSSVTQSTLVFPQPAAVPVSQAAPIQYAMTSNLAMPAYTMPFSGAAFQAFQVPQALTYWGNLQTPQQMSNFINPTTGGFSYFNVFGSLPTTLRQPMPAFHATPVEVEHPFKDIQFSESTPKDAPAATPMAADAQATSSSIISA